MAISVVLLTFNEADNIAQCLGALAWCDDIWVVDSGSTDATVAMAERAGAHVARQAWLGFAEQRNFALDRLPLKHDWILHLDADECVTPALAAELLSIANNPASGAVTAFEIPFRMRFMGRWLRHGGAYPNYQVRFGRRNRLRFRQVGHGQRESLVEGRVGRVAACLYHFNFSKGIAAWIAKHAVYARDEAIEAQARDGRAIAFDDGLGLGTRIRRRLKYHGSAMPFRPALRFFYMYILRLGFLDGVPGFHYCRLMSIYEYFVDLAQREMTDGRDVFDAAKIPR